VRYCNMAVVLSWDRVAGSRMRRRVLRAANRWRTVSQQQVTQQQVTQQPGDAAGGMHSQG
jgi:hypothetical protein